MLRLFVRTAQELTEGERAAWQTLAAMNPAGTSPYLTDGFFDAVAAARPSARVVVGIRDGEPVLFFPYHRDRFGCGRPIGGPINDYHGVIAAPGVTATPDELMRAANISLVSFKHAPAGDAVFGPTLADRHAFHVIELSNGFDAYIAARSELAKSAFRAIRTRLRKAESQHGPLTFTFDDRDPTAYEALRTWKGQQFAATGQIDVLSYDWTAVTLHYLMTSSRSPGSTHARLSTLRFGDRLAAVHLGLVAHPVMHYWFPAYDAAFQELSPGNLLLYMMAEAAGGEGFKAIHLGAGDYRYKLEFANAALPVAQGLIAADTVTGRFAGLGQAAIGALERTLPSKFAGLPAGAVRRIDRHLSLVAL